MADAGHAAPQDLRPVARTLRAALAEDPFYRGLESAASDDPARACEAMLHYYEISMIEARDHGRLDLTPDGPWGAALWSLPAPSDRAERRAAGKRRAIGIAMGPTALGFWSAAAAGMAVRSAEVIAPGEWYLSILGVHPDRQGEGLGAALLAPGLAAADTARAPVWAETLSPRNLPFYARLGFVEALAYDSADLGATVRVMRRPAGG